MRKASVLPDPVPVVTSVGLADLSRVDSRVERLRLVPVRLEPVRQPVERACASRRRHGSERRAHPQVGAAEDAGVRVGEELAPAPSRSSSSASANVVDRYSVSATFASSASNDGYIRPAFPAAC